MVVMECEWGVGATGGQGRLGESRRAQARPCMANSFLSRFQKGKMLQAEEMRKEPAGRRNYDEQGG